MDVKDDALHASMRSQRRCREEPRCRICFSAPSCCFNEVAAEMPRRTFSMQVAKLESLAGFNEVAAEMPRRTSPLTVPAGAAQEASMRSHAEMPRRTRQCFCREPIRGTSASMRSQRDAAKNSGVMGSVGGSEQASMRSQRRCREEQARPDGNRRNASKASMRSQRRCREERRARQRDHGGPSRFNEVAAEMPRRT